jgi:hypothetical protein
MGLRVSFMDAQAEMGGNDPDLPMLGNDARGNGPARLALLIETSEIFGGSANGQRLNSTWP